MLLEGFEVGKVAAQLAVVGMSVGEKSYKLEVAVTDKLTRFCLQFL